MNEAAQAARLKATEAEVRRLRAEVERLERIVAIQVDLIHKAEAS